MGGRERSRVAVLASRVRYRAPRLIAGVAGRAIARLPFGGRLERFLLERTWDSGSAAMLDRYLVSGYQNPRINVQSILVRHFLIERACGSEFPELMDGELRQAIELNELLRSRAGELGVKMGSYLDPDKHSAVREVDEAIADREQEFVRRWSAALGGVRGTRPSVLELACGSANDYRAFVECGLSAHLSYRGLDLSEKNVANARRRFPDATFSVGDMRELPYPDGGIDYVVASDVFEHLSLEGMERALDEAMRVAARGMALTFFNMGEALDHEEHRRRLYHWTRISRPRIEARLRQRYASVRAVPIAAWLRERFGYAHSYNPHAYSIFVDANQTTF